MSCFFQHRHLELSWMCSAAYIFEKSNIITTCSIILLGVLWSLMTWCTWKKPCRFDHIEDSDDDKEAEQPEEEPRHPEEPNNPTDEQRRDLKLKFPGGSSHAGYVFFFYNIAVYIYILHSMFIVFSKVFFVFLVCCGLGSLKSGKSIALNWNSFKHQQGELVCYISIPRGNMTTKIAIIRSGSWVQKWPDWQAKSKWGRGRPGKSFQPSLHLSRFMKLSRKMIKESVAGAAGLGAEEVTKEIPKASKLPKDHMQKVGTIDLQQLAKYSCSNDRMLVSCHGDIFDVSSRPDIYGWGPKSWQSGKDITWSVVTGNEKPDQCNRFYDVFKLDPEHISRYLTLICQRLVTLQDEFGKARGPLG